MMTKINAAKYSVKKNENITVRVSAVSTAPFASVSLDGKVLAPVPAAPFTYTFPITGKDGDEQGLDFAGAFDAAAPADAHYELFVQGDQGGGEFAGPWYQQGSLGAPITILFEVTA